MDPNETLRRMINLAAHINDTDFPTTDDSVVLAELVMDLHTWIIKGGFLPDRWEVASSKNV